MKTLHQIYQQYAPAVYRFALGMCGDPAWADDLAAETFVRALVSPNPIRLETVKAYLFTITRNLYLQQLRKQRRLAPLNEEIMSHKPGPESVVQNQDDLQRLLDALQQLSALDRTILLMRAQEELPYADIAAALDLSISAVKVKIFRARRKLNDLMKEL
jgi:RNA polymerase sigma-70 factor (ECF subfamily)